MTVLYDSGHSFITNSSNRKPTRKLAVKIVHQHMRVQILKFNKLVSQLIFIETIIIQIVETLLFHIQNS